MEVYQYHEKAINCLIENKLKLGITEEVAREILLELNNQHSIDNWKTEWLTFNDRWVYFELTCIDLDQKEKLWALVLELTNFFETVAPHITRQGVSMLLNQLLTT
jgi:hypothetical protein